MQGRKSLSNFPKGRYNHPVMQIKDLGEFGVIDMLNAMVVELRSGPDIGAELGFHLTVDTGDDTAAWQTGTGVELFTTDTMVEGVHFTRTTTPWRDLGWKSMASNISDVASMGGLPLYALVTLGLPPETEMDDLKELYQGMLEINNEYGVAIIGGDMVRSPVVFITVGLTGVFPEQMVGQAAGQPMLRSTANIGDLLAVTGYLGGSGGGLKLMLGGESVSAMQSGHVTAETAEYLAEYLKECHRRPHPAVVQGRVLAEAGVKTAMDISDGLADDAGKLLRSSGLAARIYAEKVPVHPDLKEAFPQDWLDLALHGGEDYQLLFAASPEIMDHVLPLLPRPAAVVGEVVAGDPGRITILDLQGQEVAAGSAGWDHFG